MNKTDFFIPYLFGLITAGAAVFIVMHSLWNISYWEMRWDMTELEARCSVEEGHKQEPRNDG